MKTIYDTSLLQDLYELGATIDSQTDKHITTHHHTPYTLSTIESVEKLLGVELIQVTQYDILWRKLWKRITL